MSESASKDEDFQETHFLIFRIMGIGMGVDTEQIYRMAESDHREGTGGTIFPFHEKVPFPAGTGPVIYRSPMVLWIRKEGTPAGVLIDQPEEILSVPVKSIRPLPPLLAANMTPPVVWGAALVREEILLLVDFYRLPGLNADGLAKSVEDGEEGRGAEGVSGGECFSEEKN